MGSISSISQITQDRIEYIRRNNPKNVQLNDEETKTFRESVNKFVEDFSLDSLNDRFFNELFDPQADSARRKGVHKEVWEAIGQHSHLIPFSFPSEISYYYESLARTTPDQLKRVNKKLYKEMAAVEKGCVLLFFYAYLSKKENKESSLFPKAKEYISAYQRHFLKGAKEKVLNDKMLLQCDGLAEILVEKIGDYEKKSVLGNGNKTNLPCMGDLVEKKITCRLQPCELYPAQLGAVKAASLAKADKVDEKIQSLLAYLDEKESSTFSKTIYLHEFFTSLSLDPKDYEEIPIDRIDTVLENLSTLSKSYADLVVLNNSNGLVESELFHWVLLDQLACFFAVYQLAQRSSTLKVDQYAPPTINFAFFEKENVFFTDEELANRFEKLRDAISSMRGGDPSKQELAFWSVNTDDLHKKNDSSSSRRPTPNIEYLKQFYQWNQVSEDDIRNRKEEEIDKTYRESPERAARLKRELPGKLEQLKRIEESEINKQPLQLPPLYFFLEESFRRAQLLVEAGYVLDQESIKNIFAPDALKTNFSATKEITFDTKDLWDSGVRFNTYNYGVNYDQSTRNTKNLFRSKKIEDKRLLWILEKDKDYIRHAEATSENNILLFYLNQGESDEQDSAIYHCFQKMLLYDNLIIPELLHVCENFPHFAKNSSNRTAIEELFLGKERLQKAIEEEPGLQDRLIRIIQTNIEKSSATRDVECALYWARLCIHIQKKVANGRPPSSELIGRMIDSLSKLQEQVKDEKDVKTQLSLWDRDIARHKAYIFALSCDSLKEDKLEELFSSWFESHYAYLHEGCLSPHWMEYEIAHGIAKYVQKSSDFGNAIKRGFEKFIERKYSEKLDANTWNLNQLPLVTVSTSAKKHYTVDVLSGAVFFQGSRFWQDSLPWDRMDEFEKELVLEGMRKGFSAQGEHRFVSSDETFALTISKNEEIFIEKEFALAGKKERLVYHKNNAFAFEANHPLGTESVLWMKEPLSSTNEGLLATKQGKLLARVEKKSDKENDWIFVRIDEEGNVIQPRQTACFPEKSEQLWTEDLFPSEKTLFWADGEGNLRSIQFPPADVGGLELVIDEKNTIRCSKLEKSFVLKERAPENLAKHLPAALLFAKEDDDLSRKMVLPCLNISYDKNKPERGGLFLLPPSAEHPPFYIYEIDQNRGRLFSSSTEAMLYLIHAFMAKKDYENAGAYLARLRLNQDLNKREEKILKEILKITDEKDPYLVALQCRGLLLAQESNVLYKDFPQMSGEKIIRAYQKMEGDRQTKNIPSHLWINDHEKAKLNEWSGSSLFSISSPKVASETGKRQTTYFTNSSSHTTSPLQGGRGKGDIPSLREKQPLHDFYNKYFIPMRKEPLFSRDKETFVLNRWEEKSDNPLIKEQIKMYQEAHALENQNKLVDRHSIQHDKKEELKKKLNKLAENTKTSKESLQKAIEAAVNGVCVEQRIKNRIGLSQSLTVNDIILEPDRIYRLFDDKARSDALFREVLEYIEIATLLQRTQRALSALEEGNEQLAGELLLYKRNYDCYAHQELLLYEYFSGNHFLSDPDQVSILKKIIAGIFDQKKPLGIEETRKLFFEFQAGGGKTKVLSAILALKAIREGKHPIFFSLPDLVGVVEVDLANSLNKFFERNIHRVSIDLSDRMHKADWENLYRQITEAGKKGMCDLMTPETWHALHVNYKQALEERRRAEDDNEDFSDTRIKKIIDYYRANGVLLVDEGDVNLNALLSTKIADGEEAHLTRNEQRLLLDTCKALIGIGDQPLFEGDTQEKKDFLGILSNEQAFRAPPALEELKNKLVSFFCGHDVIFPEFERLGLTNLEVCDYVDFLLDKAKPAPKYLEDLHHWKNNQGRPLYLAKGLIHSLVPHALSSENLMNYGPSINSEDFSYSPYEYKNPCTSKFENIYVTAILTIQGYFQNGLSLDDLRKLCQNCEVEYRKKIQAGEREDNIPLCALFTDMQEGAEKIPLSSLNETKWEDDAWMQSVLMPKMAKNHKAIEYFLQTISLPTLKSFTSQYVSTAADLQQQGAWAMIVFSAILGSSHKFAREASFLPQTAFMANVIQRSCMPENRESLITTSHTTEELFEEMYREKKLEGLEGWINVGGFDKERAPCEIAREFLHFTRKHHDLEYDGVVYFKTVRNDHTGKEEKILYLLRKGDKPDNDREIRLEGSDLRTELRKHNVLPERVFKIFDPSETTGTDFYFSPNAKAALLLGKKVPASRLAQAIMRMRQFLKLKNEKKESQTLIWIVPELLKQEIEQELSLPLSKESFQESIWFWAITNEVQREKETIIAQARQEIDAVLWDAIQKEIAEADENEKKFLLQKYSHAIRQEADQNPASLWAGGIALEETSTYLQKYADSRSALWKKPYKNDHTLNKKIKKIIDETANVIPQVETGKSSLSQTAQQREQQREVQNQKEFQVEKRHAIKGKLEEFEIAKEFDYAVNEFSLDKLSQWTKSRDGKIQKTSHLYKANFLSGDLYSLCNAHNASVKFESWKGDLYFQKPIDHILVVQDNKKAILAYCVSLKDAQQYKKQILEGKIEKGYQVALFSPSGELIQTAKSTDGSAKIDLEGMKKNPIFQKILLSVNLINGRVWDKEKVLDLLNKNEKEFVEFWERVRTNFIDESLMDTGYFQSLVAAAQKAKEPEKSKANADQIKKIVDDYLREIERKKREKFNNKLNEILPLIPTLTNLINNRDKRKLFNEAKEKYRPLVDRLELHERRWELIQKNKKKLTDAGLSLDREYHTMYQEYEDIENEVAEWKKQIAADLCENLFDVEILHRKESIKTFEELEKWKEDIDSRIREFRFVKIDDNIYRTMNENCDKLKKKIIFSDRKFMEFAEYVRKKIEEKNNPPKETTINFEISDREESSTESDREESSTESDGSEDEYPLSPLPPRPFPKPGTKEPGSLPKGIASIRSGEAARLPNGEMEEIEEKGLPPSTPFPKERSDTNKEPESFPKGIAGIRNGEAEPLPNGEMEEIGEMSHPRSSEKRGETLLPTLTETNPSTGNAAAPQVTPLSQGSGNPSLSQIPKYTRTAWIRHLFTTSFTFRLFSFLTFGILPLFAYIVGPGKQKDRRLNTN